MGVDYLAFRQSYRNSLMHSPKGTTWKDHKYIKKIDGKYIYKEAKEVVSSAGEKVIDAGKDISWGLETFSKNIKDEYWKKMGTVLDKIGEKRLEHELSKDGGRYQYWEYNDQIRKKDGKESGYSIRTDLKLDDFVIINGEVYKKTIKGNDKNYTKVR